MLYFAVLLSLCVGFVVGAVITGFLLTTVLSSDSQKNITRRSKKNISSIEKDNGVILLDEKHEQKIVDDLQEI